MWEYEALIVNGRMKGLAYVFAFVFISRFRWTMRGFDCSISARAPVQEDPGDEQTFNETGFESFRNKGNVSVLSVFEAGKDVFVLKEIGISSRASVCD